jgi:glutathione S-transferase
MYTLHYSAGACSLAAHLVLEETGAPYELVAVNLKDGQQHGEAFRALNPKGRVPVLIDGDIVLTEVSAIMIYLARKHPAAGLLPENALQLGRCVEWCSWLGSSVHAAAVAQIWRPNRFADDESLHPAISAKGRLNLAECFGQVESRLQKGQWAVDNRYSIVDPYLLVFYRWGYRMDLDMRTLFPTWTDHAERLFQRPAIRKALEQEGIGIWP